ncbi:MAG TPA: peptide ABC transporter substrate-binding protein [Myxococcales bacterium]|nr:peptide ABC transporter substrate-binding protein [Myxococcales bacterium]
MSRPALVVLLLASTALAGGRPRYGGVLRVALASPVADPEPLTVDRPETAALAALLAPPLCRLDPQRGVVPTVVDVSRSQPNRVQISLRAGGLRRPSDLADRWSALSQPASLSPYRALLAPLRGEGRGLTASAGTFDVALSYPWPDLERTLCHPALGMPDGGPYTATPPRVSFAFNLASPEGRPFPDRLQLVAADERRATRLFSTRQADLLLGATVDDAQAGGGPGPVPAAPAPALFATYLVYRSAHAGAELRTVLEQSVDPQDLVQRFISAPAVPMTQLLPPALMPAAAAPPAPVAGPAPRAPGRELTLFYDTTLDEHRAVAERIQVRLHDRGYRLTLKPVTRAELGARWASGDYDLMLRSLLLPPVPAAALALAIELAGRHDLLAVELSTIGAVADANARDARARERAAVLRASLPLLPLYARAPQLSAAPQVLGLRADGFGLPMLDQVFLSQE